MRTCAKILFLVGMVLASVFALSQVAIALEVGDKAPNFTLESTDGEKVSLSQFRGKKNVLVQFYTTDFNPT